MEASNILRLRTGSCSQDDPCDNCVGVRHISLLLVVIYIDIPFVKKILTALAFIPQDCDTDFECAGELVCFQTEVSEKATVPGCLGHTQIGM